MGYPFGAVARAVLVDVKKYEHLIIPGVLCAGVLVRLFLAQEEKGPKVPREHKHVTVPRLPRKSKSITTRRESRMT
jgi:hypothetical protein